MVCVITYVYSRTMVLPSIIVTLSVLDTAELSRLNPPGYFCGCDAIACLSVMAMHSTHIRSPGLFPHLESSGVLSV